MHLSATVAKVCSVREPSEIEVSDSVVNVCEHGDHPAPAGKRYCSLDCERCDAFEISEFVCDRCRPPAMIFVPLSKGLFALVGATDAPRVREYKWQVKLRPRGTAYAVATIRGVDGRRRMVQLHRFVWDLHGGCETPIVDHENGVGIDCQWRNLRAATHLQNAWNASAHRGSKSGVRGVSYDARSRKWIARVTRAGKRVRVAACEKREDAVEARDRAVREMHGEFAR